MATKAKRRVVARKTTTFGRVYPSYLFKDHDPILDKIDTLRSDAAPEMTTKAISAGSGLAAQTISNWRRRKVKRPQFASVAAFVNFIGGEIRVVYRGRKIES